jgi:hypothetical protein
MVSIQTKRVCAAAERLRTADRRPASPYRWLLNAQCPNSTAGGTDISVQISATSITSRGNLQNSQTEKKAAAGGPMVPRIPDGRRTRLIKAISPHDQGGFPQTRLDAGDAHCVPISFIVI